MYKTAIRYLEQNRANNTDILEPILRGTGEIIAADKDGVLVFEREAKLYLLTAETIGTAKKFVDMIDDLRFISVHQNYIADMITKKFELRRIMCCRQAIWTGCNAPVIQNTSLELRVLGIEMAEEIELLYSHDIGIDYISRRLSAGEIFGAFYRGELTGFIGLHEEGSMGMLEVKPEFRRRGIGSYLIAMLCKHQISLGKIPFSQFTVENKESHKLHKKLGFLITDEFIYWLEKI